MRLHIIITLFLASGLQAQVFTPPSGGSTPPTNNPPRDVASNPQSQPAPSPFGQEIPLLDPSAETVTVGGVTIPLGDNRLLKARFEKYLSQPPEDSEAAMQYRQNIDQILATISPFRNEGPDLHAAFKLLPSAATYPGDANICMTLAESIYTAMLSKKDTQGLELLNESLDKEKDELIRKEDWFNRHDNGGRPMVKDGDVEDEAKQEVRAAVRLRSAEVIRRIGEIEALRKKHLVQTEIQTLRAKTQFQVNMIQWFMQRRYEHVLMASRFYNQIWKDGDSALHIDKNSDVSKMFSESIGVNPAVSSLDSFSNDAIRETAKYVEAFNMMLSRDELHSASQRLMEAYALGEYLAPVATLELEKKRQVLDYFRDLNELHGAMQARDYVKARELSDSLKQRAKDYPSSKIDSAISGYTLAADLAIDEAKAHLIGGDRESASDKIRQATEIWPTNPKLKEFRDLIGASGKVVQIRNDFDRLISERNYREIARRQYEIAPAIQGDVEREAAFEEIITNLTEIEKTLSKAKEFSQAGQKYAAWEQLAEIREQFPDDPKLGREMELLAPEVADFTLALSKAKEYENRTPQQTGTALSWYLKAHSIHPQSAIADEGVMRLVSQIMPAD